MNRELEEWLKENYSRTDNKVIMKLTGLSIAQVKYAAKKLGVRKGLTDSEKKWLKENYSCTQNRVLSEKLGISIRRVKHFAKMNGLRKTKEHVAEIIRLSNGKPLTEEQEAWMRLNYSDTRNEEIAERLGVCLAQVSRIASRMGLKKDSEYLRMASAITGRRTRAREKARVTFGMPQRTNMKVVRQSDRRYYQRYYLKCRGYMIDEEERVAYWDEKTRRAKQMEKKKDGIYDYAPIDELREEYHPEFLNKRNEYLKKELI